LGGIVEARDEHKNFLTKYHQSFVQMLCANQDFFFRAEKKGSHKTFDKIFLLKCFKTQKSPNPNISFG